jgi:hypothetical protein
MKTKQANVITISHKTGNGEVCFISTWQCQHSLAAITPHYICIPICQKKQKQAK